MKKNVNKKVETSEASATTPAQTDVTKELFVNVYGYEDVKNELNRIKSWLSNEEYLNNPDLMLPNAVLFHGHPGCGKTLMLREFANSFNAPIFTIEGEDDCISKEISDKFKKAREEKFAIVLIDELDLLIGKSFQVERALQQELDGINTKGKILVLATTNNIRDISDALTRPGRFDRLIRIDYPDKESRKELIKNFIANLKGDDSQVNYDHVSKVCSRCSCVQLKAVCNDAYLRCGNVFTTTEIENSYERIVNRDFADKSGEFKDYRVAVHECGHSIMALAFKDNWTFYSAKFNSTGGVTEFQETDERSDTITKREQKIMIGLAGYLAEEVVFGKHEVGSWSDYCKCYEACERLVERVCFQGIGNLVTEDQYNGDGHWTNKKKLKNDRKIYRLLKKFERKTRSYLKKHKNELESLAKIMYEKGKCTYKDVESLKSVQAR